MSYGKVKDTFWTDKKVQAFSDDAKMLALYLMTGPHRNILGCMRVPDGYILSDLKWVETRLSDAIDMLSERRFICRDDDGWTFILNQIKHDPIKVPNHARAAIAIADTVPAESVVFRELRPRLLAALEAIKMASEWHPQEIVIPEPLPEPAPEPGPAPVEAPTAPPLASPPLSAPVVIDDPLKADDEISDAAPPAIITKRGSRLPGDWQPTIEDIGFCEIHRPDLDPGEVADTFRDYWISAPGQKGVKLEWAATWRNWVRSQRQGPRPNGQSRTMQALDNIAREYRP
jgi:hypothetical protein